MTPFDSNGERKSTMKEPRTGKDITLSKTSKRNPNTKVGELVEVNTGNGHVLAKVIGFAGYEGGATHYLTADGKEGRTDGVHVTLRKYGKEDTDYIRSQRGKGVNPGNTAYNNRRNEELDALEDMEVE